MNFIVSSIPGRLRLHHAALRNPQRLARLAAVIGAWPQVQFVIPNARAGSLRVLYDATALQEADCNRRCETALQQLLPAGTPREPDRVAQRKARSRAQPLNPNRLAKRGMLASLVLSMLLAATGAKKWHALTGVFFLHALGVHLWTHRRQILK